jgi:hypothetical protein
LCQVWYLNFKQRLRGKSCISEGMGVRDGATALAQHNTEVKHCSP